MNTVAGHCLDLPSAIWGEIVQKLNTQEKASLRGVCSRLREVVNVSVTRLQLDQTRCTDAEAWGLAERFPNVKQLAFNKAEKQPVFNDQGFAQVVLHNLSRLRKLDYIDLTHCSHISVASLATVVACCPHIRRLALPGCDNTLLQDRDLAVLQYLACLERLAIDNGMYVSDATFAALAPLTRLTYLKIWTPSGRVGNSSLCQLSSLTRLQTIDLELRSSQLDAGELVGVLVGLQQLRDITLYDININQEQLDLLAGLPQLTRLFVGNISLTSAPRKRFPDVFSGLTCNQVRGMGLLLPALPSITELFCDADNETLEAVAAQVRLRELRVWGLKEAQSGLTDEGLKRLTGLTNLGILEVTAPRTFSDHCLIPLASSLSQLRNLILKKCEQITDSGLVIAVSHLRQLTHVYLEQCGAVGDPGVMALAMLPMLQSLKVYKCRGVSKDVRDYVRTYATRSDFTFDIHTA